MSKQVRFVWKESLILWSIRKRRRAKSDFGIKQVNAGISGIGRSDTQSQTHNQRKNRSCMTLADHCKKLYHLCNGRIWQRTINRRTASCFMTRGSFFCCPHPIFSLLDSPPHVNLASLPRSGTRERGLPARPCCRLWPRQQAVLPSSGSPASHECQECAHHSSREAEHPSRCPDWHVKA